MISTMKLSLHALLVALSAELVLGSQLRSLQATTTTTNAPCAGEQLDVVTNGCSSAEACQATAIEMGFQLGSAEWPFIGNWADKGCVVYGPDHEEYPNQAYFGVGWQSCAELRIRPAAEGIRIRCNGDESGTSIAMDIENMAPAFDPLRCPGETMCRTVQDCRQEAIQQGYSLGSQLEPFQGDYFIKGCTFYPFDHPDYPGQSFWGTGASICGQLRADPSAVDGAQRMECGTSSQGQGPVVVPQAPPQGLNEVQDGLVTNPQPQGGGNQGQGAQNVGGGNQGQQQQNNSGTNQGQQQQQQNNGGGNQGQQQQNQQNGNQGQQQQGSNQGQQQQNNGGSNQGQQQQQNQGQQQTSGGSNQGQQQQQNQGQQQQNQQNGNQGQQQQNNDGSNQGQRPEEVSPGGSFIPQNVGPDQQQQNQQNGNQGQQQQASNQGQQQQNNAGNNQGQQQQQQGQGQQQPNNGGNLQGQQQQNGNQGQQQQQNQQQAASGQETVEQQQQEQQEQQFPPQQQQVPPGQQPAQAPGQSPNTDLDDELDPRPENNKDQKNQKEGFDKENDKDDKADKEADSGALTISAIESQEAATSAAESPMGVGAMSLISLFMGAMM